MRPLILRSFNRAKLGMEDVSGTDLNKIIGIGTRTDAMGKSTLVTEMYPNYHKNMIRAFTSYPITKYFGLSIDKAMALPVDQWYAIRDAARLLSAQQPDNTESQLLEIIKTLTTPRGSDDG